MRQDPDLPHTADPVALELRVLGGPQRGARTPLPAFADCIVLASPGAALARRDTTASVVLVASESARLHVQRNGEQGVRVRLLEGAATLAGTPLPVNADVAWEAATPMQVGETRLAYGPAQEDDWTPLPHAPHVPREPRGAPDTAAADDAARAPAAVSGAERRWPVYLAGVGVVLVGLSAGLGALVNLIPAHAGESAAANAATGAMAAKPPARVQRDAEQAVAEVFRLHGVKAQVTQGANGQLEVATRTADVNLLARAEAAVRRDLPGAPALQVKNQPPARAAASPSLHNDPGKRITAVITDAELPYVVTADGSRYFTGALLPSGHRVVAIGDRLVKVELDGQSTELTL